METERLPPKTEQVLDSTWPRWEIPQLSKSRHPSFKVDPQKSHSRLDICKFLKKGEGLPRQRLSMAILQTLLRVSVKWFQTARSSRDGIIHITWKYPTAQFHCRRQPKVIKCWAMQSHLWWKFSFQSPNVNWAQYHFWNEPSTPKSQFIGFIGFITFIRAIRFNRVITFVRFIKVWSLNQVIRAPVTFLEMDVTLADMWFEGKMPWICTGVLGNFLLRRTYSFSQDNYWGQIPVLSGLFEWLLSRHSLVMVFLKKLIIQFSLKNWCWQCDGRRCDRSSTILIVNSWETSKNREVSRQEMVLVASGWCSTSHFAIFNWIC
jgi:hypothetical protein